MKVRMVNWAGRIANLPTWFKSGEDIELTWEQIKELYDTGNNVMLVHQASVHNVDLDAVLFVDNKCFTNR